MLTFLTQKNAQKEKKGTRRVQWSFCMTLIFTYSKPQMQILPTNRFQEMQLNVWNKLFLGLLGFWHHLLDHLIDKLGKSPQTIFIHKKRNHQMSCKLRLPGCFLKAPKTCIICKLTGNLSAVQYNCETTKLCRRRTACCKWWKALKINIKTCT